MNITIRTDPLADLDCEVLIVGHFEGGTPLEGMARTLDQRCGGIISELIDGGDFKGKVYTSIIPRNVRLAEAPSYGLSIHDYDSKSKGSESYMELAEEFLFLQD